MLRGGLRQSTDEYRLLGPLITGVLAKLAITKTSLAIKPAIAHALIAAYGHAAAGKLKHQMMGAIVKSSIGAALLHASPALAGFLTPHTILPIVGLILAYEVTTLPRHIGRDVGTAIAEALRVELPSIHASVIAFYADSAATELRTEIKDSSPSRRWVWLGRRGPTTSGPSQF